MNLATTSFLSLSTFNLLLLVNQRYRTVPRFPMALSLSLSFHPPCSIIYRIAVANKSRASLASHPGPPPHPHHQLPALNCNDGKLKDQGEKETVLALACPISTKMGCEKKQRGLLDCANTEKVGVCRQAKETSGKINMRRVSPLPLIFSFARAYVF